MSRDWQAWHRAYDDTGSELSRRLDAVVKQLRDALDRAAPGPVTVLSLCGGQARDIAAAASGHPRASDLCGAVVELDPELAAEARRNLARAGVDIEVRAADAADVGSYLDLVPVDVLVLVGIFGNIDVADIRTTIAAMPSLCSRGATVVWTRHRRAPDLTVDVRRWFEEAGCEPRSFESAGVGTYGVGANVVGDRLGEPPATRLFTFRDDLGPGSAVQLGD
jgi:SAM-dependent methyltransferase